VFSGNYGGLKDIGMLLMSVAPIRSAIKINGDNHGRRDNDTGAKT